MSCHAHDSWMTTRLAKSQQFGDAQGPAFFTRGATSSDIVQPARPIQTQHVPGLNPLRADEW